MDKVGIEIRERTYGLTGLIKYMMLRLYVTVIIMKTGWRLLEHDAVCIFEGWVSECGTDE
jgi:hypothetical protein